MSERVPWKDSNLALIGSDLDHKIKEAAASGEPQWDGLGESAALKVWRVEQFRVVPWPEDQHGKFHVGDSYIVLNSYVKEESDALLHDLHIWIGKESSQDEYGTAAYKMVEADDSLGGAPIQHRQVQGHESHLFKSYFDELYYLPGGTETGFNHVEPTKDQPHLYKVKGTEKGMSLAQVGLSKSDLNKGDSFILFANAELVWVWHGEAANPDEKARANIVAEKMCTQGTVAALDQGQGDDEAADFWAYLGDGEIADADEDDEAVEEFAPVLFKVVPDEQPEVVAEGEKMKIGFMTSSPMLQRSLLDPASVFLLDAGCEVFVWIGKEANRQAKLAALSSADAYCKANLRTCDVPVTIVKSGYENSDFTGYFVD